MLDRITIHPEANNLSTKATVIRMPRIVGWPMQISGWMVIRSNICF